MSARSETDAGFTIVETLIFLAISGLMFALAINAMSGKQQQTEFDTGVDTLQSDLNQSLSNVADGNYLSLPDNTCGRPAIADPPEGTCTIMGEIIAFNTDVTPQTFSVYPVVGYNYDDNTPSQLSTDFTQAEPTIETSINQTTPMPFGLSVISSNDGSHSFGAFGIFSFTSFEGGTAEGQNGALNSGSEHVEVFSIPDSSLGESSSNLETYVNNLENCTEGDQTLTTEVCYSTESTPFSVIDPADGLTFCVSYSSSGPWAEFTIGGSNSPSTATYQIYNDGGECTDA